MAYLPNGCQICVLNGPFKEEVYVGQPPDFVVKDQELEFYKLKRALCGSKNAPRDWNRRIDDFLKDIGFKKCVLEHGVYMKTDASEGVIILCLCMDDLLITSSNDKCISKLKSEVMHEFEMSDLGLMTYFLGIEFHKSKMGLLMHQRRYAFDILKKCEMEHCNTSISPTKPRLKLSKNKDEEYVDPTRYRRLIRSLRYLCNTRPNLVFTVGIVSRLMDIPKVSHMAAVKRIMRNVKGSVGCGILFL